LKKTICPSEPRMKITHANRGMGLENIILGANRQYKNKGIAIVEKMPTPWIPQRNGSGKLVSCIVKEKACVDFVGVYQSTPIAFDAKESKLGKIDLKRVEAHQGDFLSNWEKHGGVSFILVELLVNRRFMVPWALWEMRKQVRAAGNCKASLGIDDIANYEVFGTSRAIVDYLVMVDKWINRRGEPE